MNLLDNEKIVPVDEKFIELGIIKKILGSLKVFKKKKSDKSMRMFYIYIIIFIYPWIYANLLDLLFY